MSPRLSLLLAPLVLLCGCATSSSSGAPASSGGTGGSGSAVGNGNITVNAAGRSTSALFEGNSLTAPNVSVAVTEDAARGRVATAPVDLTLKKGEVVGVVGQQGQTKLQVQQQAGGLVAQGKFAGSPSALLFTPQKLEGRFLQCTYVLQRAAAPAAGTATGGSGGGGELTYEGKRNCVGAQNNITTVRLPATFTQLSPERQATILNLVLAR
jgi:hypothetical protein